MYLKKHMIVFLAMLLCSICVACGSGDKEEQKQEIGVTTENEIPNVEIDLEE